MYGVWRVRLIIATGSQRSSRPRPWVARLLGLHDQWGFERDFVRGYYDYTYASKKGKGTVMYFPLPPGIYERYQAISWKHEIRDFVRVDDNGELYEVTREWILESLTSANSE